MIWGTLVFLFTERGDLSAFWDKHGRNASEMLKDALPLIERYRARVAPTNETVNRVEAAVRKATETANPQPGDEFSPTNPNRDAG